MNDRCFVGTVQNAKSCVQNGMGAPCFVRLLDLLSGRSRVRFLPGAPPKARRAREKVRGGLCRASFERATCTLRTPKASLARGAA